MSKLITAVSLGLALSFSVLPAMAQKTEVKRSGSEAKQAGTSLGRNVRHGRLARGGKSFGKHMGQAGKHFGRSTKKAFKRVF